MTPTNAKEPAVDVAYCEAKLKSHCRYCPVEADIDRIMDQLHALLAERSALLAIIAELVRAKRDQESWSKACDEDDDYWNAHALRRADQALTAAWAAAFAVVDAKEKENA